MQPKCHRVFDRSEVIRRFFGNSRRPEQGKHKMNDFELDQLVGNALVALDQADEGKPIEMVINGGRTQTKHAQRRFFARVRRTRPDLMKLLQQRVVFVSAREFVSYRHDRPKPHEKVGHGQALRAVAAPVQPPERITRKLALTPDDGELYAWVEHMRGLLREAGICEMTFDTQSPEVTMTGEVSA